MATTLEELRAQVREAEKAERDALEARRTSVKAEYAFTLMPASQIGSFERIMDDSCVFYRLQSEVLNKEAVEAVGGEHHDKSGGNYLFNKASGKFVMMVGGGRLWLSSSNWQESSEAWELLSAFIVGKPEGGDVTEIVEQYRNPHSR